jgi:hypothetical protein
MHPRIRATRQRRTIAVICRANQLLGLLLGWRSIERAGDTPRRRALDDTLANARSQKVCGNSGGRPATDAPIVEKIPLNMCAISMRRTGAVFIVLGLG